MRTLTRTFALIFFLGSVIGARAGAEERTVPEPPRRVVEIQMEAAVKERILLAQRNKTHFDEVKAPVEETKKPAEPSVWEKLQQSVDRNEF